MTAKTRLNRLERKTNDKGGRCPSCPPILFWHDWEHPGEPEPEYNRCTVCGRDESLIVVKALTPEQDAEIRRQVDGEHMRTELIE